ncbi:MAG: DUF6786 family protein [Algisphaera sp.]
MSQKIHTLSAGDGTLQVATRGARVLSCHVDGEDANLFYEDAEGNGGDRLWIAPEVAYNWTSLEAAREDPVAASATPKVMDPGTWAVHGTWDGGLTLAQSLELTDVRDGKRIELAIKRTVSAIAPPFGLPDGVACTSFTVVNDLTATGGDDGAVAAAWDILQIPVTGTLVCPTTRRVEPRSYYEPFGDKHVQVADDSVRFLVDHKRRVKMGLRPEHTTGRMGFLRSLKKGQSSLIVRVFSVLPGEQYVDIPRDHPADQRSGGDALQAYNDDLTYGPFGEMEYVTPAVVVGGCQHRNTACVTHAMVGPDALIREAGEALLGVAVGLIE